MNPYDWFPGYGESKLWPSFQQSGKLFIDIDYDSPEDRNILLSRRLSFTHVFDSRISFFPGSGLPIDIPRAAPKVATDGQVERESEFNPRRIGALEVYPGSSTAASWRARFPNLEMRHYVLRFLEEKYQFDVIAEDWHLGEERIVPSKKGRRIEPPVAWSKEDWAQ